jgi:hypothetical protein
MLHVFINNHNDHPNSQWTKMATKYIKFGLRADKNLSDLENPNEALSNLLNNLSTQVDENGLPTGFTTNDLAPLIGLRNTGLASNVTTTGTYIGTSTDLISLNNSLVEYTPASAPNTKLEVQPRITIQDNISNFKTILGDPPYIRGGDGPIARFIPSTRINPSIGANTNGNSAAVTPTFAALGTNLYSTLVSAALPAQIVDGEDFWNNGVFQFGSKIYPTFPNTYGMVQWTGYLSAYFTQEWESTGLFMIEQDIIDDGTNNNWTTLKNVYSKSFTLTNLTWSFSGTTTTIQLGTTQVKSICRGMKVTISGTAYTVTAVNEVGGTCTIVGALTNATPSPLTFAWTISDDLIRTGTLVFSQPRTGGRRRVRYTAWWPNPVDVGLTANSTYRTKRFAYAIELSERLPFSMIYSTNNTNQTFGQYTYEYFKRNRGSVLKQDSTAILRVNNTISMNYTSPGLLSDVVRSMTSGATTVTPRSFIMEDSYGKLVGNFTGCTLGDWLVFTISTTSYAFQIQEIASDTTIYVREDLLTLTSSVRGASVTNGVVFRNLGLIGLFRLEAAAATVGTSAQASLYPLAGTVTSVDNVYNDYIVTAIQTAGTNGVKPIRITSVSAKGTNPKTITASDYLANSAAFTATGSPGTHICAVYSSRGLEDLSSIDQCTGVFGREVNVTAAAGATAITLTTNVGVTAGDFVQFAGVITDGTTVSSLTGSTIVNLSQGVITGKTLNKASTLIFVKAANRVAGVNKEYCVIPLNTAPPFEGTDLGLVTPASNSSLIVRNFKFGELDVTVPSAKIQTTTATAATKYFPIIYNGVTYRALIA